MNAADDPILTHHSGPSELVDRESQHNDMAPEMLSLRPGQFSEYIGQAEVVETLRIGVQAALQRKEPIDHVLLHGPPGLGKTTLAHIIANEMGTNVTVTSGPALEKGGDLIGILTHLEAGDLIFVDEIHRLSKAVEEFLYPAMEDWAIDFVFDKGLHARSHRFQLKPFTLVGATTRVGLLSAPLRDRFGIFRNLEFYNVPDLMVIVLRSAKLLDIEIDKAGAKELARRSRGTPRIVNRLLRRVRDYAQVRADGTVTHKIVDAALALEGVDGRGLTNLDRRYLQTIVSHYQGGPVGIEAIAATLQEEADTLVDVVEPFLLTEGFVIRTPSGRRITADGQRHLGLPAQSDLFD